MEINKARIIMLTISNHLIDGISIEKLAIILVGYILITKKKKKDKEDTKNICV